MIDLGVVTPNKVSTFFCEILCKGASGNVAKKIQKNLLCSQKNSENQVTLPFVENLMAETRPG